MNYPMIVSPKKGTDKQGMKFKYKALLGFAGTAIFLIAVQIGVQFVSSYKFVGFAKRDQSTWIGLAETAQADNWTCQQQLEEMKKMRDTENSDIMGEIK